MAKYIIPEEFISGFKELSFLNKDLTYKISDILKKLDIGDGPETLAKKLSDNKHLSKLDLSLISFTIFSLISLAQKENIDHLVDNLTQAYSLQNKEARKDEIINLKNNLITILNSIDKINLTFKARKLQSEYDKIFTDCRVISDIRLIFLDKPYESPKQAVIIHNLKVEYQQNEEIKESFFALDLADLKKLKEQIERAIEKENIIKSKINQEITFIEIKE